MGGFFPVMFDPLLSTVRSWFVVILCGGNGSETFGEFLTNRTVLASMTLRSPFMGKFCTCREWFDRTLTPWEFIWRYRLLVNNSFVGYETPTLSAFVLCIKLQENTEDLGFQLMEDLLENVDSANTKKQIKYAVQITCGMKKAYFYTEHAEPVFSMNELWRCLELF